VTHELRTPITVIRGHLETLPEEVSERTHVIALVTDELERMGRLVQDLLLIARAEQPGMLNLDVVDVAVLTEEMHEKMKALARRNWIVEQSGVGRVVADRQRMTQAVMQLAENAAKHTTERGLIALGSQVHDGQVRFWIRDTGPGIPAEEQERIFQRSAHGRDWRSANGTGLGLAIVRSIAVAHHGRVELASEHGKGSRFTIVIPIDQPPRELS
jgi:signal transduction histidine kinase